MIEKIVNTWLSDMRNDLENNYLKLGLKASGNWPKQLEPYSELSKSSVKVGMLGERYTGAIEFGRRPNEDQSDEGLARWVGWAGSTFLDQWVKDKGLNISPYAVAWKIAREGWKIPNEHNDGGLVSDVLTSDRIQELTKSISFSYVEKFKSDFLKQIKQ